MANKKYKNTEEKKPKSMNLCVGGFMYGGWECKDWEEC